MVIFFSPRSALFKHHEEKDHRLRSHTVVFLPGRRRVSHTHASPATSRDFYSGVDFHLFSSCQGSAHHILRRVQDLILVSLCMSFISSTTRRLHLCILTMDFSFAIRCGRTVAQRPGPSNSMGRCATSATAVTWPGLSPPISSTRELFRDEMELFRKQHFARPCPAANIALRNQNAAQRLHARGALACTWRRTLHQTCRALANRQCEPEAFAPK